jgi:hypothetical protein
MYSHGFHIAFWQTPRAWESGQTHLSILMTPILKDELEKWGIGVDEKVR